ncbi:MAG: HEAT repeat domain-containing protein [Anaerolineales bacterium]|nr:HEAT repeat domain-containing protein [Anaerolineales bacterium]MCS7246615.1 HEAT repeat domain-containing protein [Anaerolineales bacterium]MDW8160424.1 HEAT repeat domain-containing protein [Anaerolineales bacterium]MDW8447793.1 HEAT repeat domain-containing protein [Anaerolineales bacterium]
MKDPTRITLDQLKQALLDVSRPLPPVYLYRLSDLSDQDLSEIKSFWNEIPTWRKQALMEDIEELSENDPLLSYENLSLFALSDADERVRELAIRSLSYYEEPSYLNTLLNILENDQSAIVRAEAASALGRFVYMGEVDELPAERLREVEDRLIQIFTSNDALIVRRCALESLGYSSRPEVEDFMREAYYSGNRDLLASSLHAMGRSANSDWTPLVEAMLDHEDPVIRYEAARAAGELEATTCRRRLLELVDDPDLDVRLAAIWSLSQIGGEGVMEKFMHLYETTEDDEVFALLEDAMDNLAFTEGNGFFGLLDIERMTRQDDEEDLEDYLEEEWDDFADEDYEDDEEDEI